MTITQIEYLLAVVECGNFSVAAHERCFVTQPSLSTQIKNLEEELGVTLLDRGKKPIVPTEIGYTLIDQMKRALSEFDAIKDIVHEQKNELKGTLVLAVIPTIAPYVLHKFIPKFAKHNPDLKIEVKELYTYQIEQGIANGSIDIGMLAAGFIDNPDVTEEVLYSDKFYLYVSRQNSLYGSKQITASQININDLMLLPDGHCLRSQIVNLCDSHSYQKGKVLYESGSLETIVRIVDTTAKSTIIPQMMLPFISQERRPQVIPFSEEVNASRDIAFAVNRRFYKRGVYNALKEIVIESTIYERLL